MTREGILELTDQQLADMAATEVMGWTESVEGLALMDVRVKRHWYKGEGKYLVRDLWKPYEDLNQAFMLVEKAKEDFDWYISGVSNECCVRLDYHNWPKKIYSTEHCEDSLPRAITIACILALHSDSEGLAAKGL